MTWKPVELRRVASITMGQSPPGETYNSNREGLPFFQGKAEFGEEHPVATKWCTAPSRVAQPGDVLLSVRAPVGPTNVAVERCCIGRGLAAIRADTQVLDQRYLLHVLRFKATDLARRGQGSTFDAIGRADVEQIAILVPTLSEQRRIVEILDQADRLRRLRAEADAKADRILPALFIKMFGDPATNPMYWEEDTIGNIAETISDGPFGSNLKTSHYMPEGVRVVRLQNIGIGKFLDTDRAFVSHEHFDKLSKHRCLPGDVLVGTLGDPNLRACMLPATVPEALNKADCVQIRAREGRATNEYICWLLNMPSTLLLAQDLIHGQTRTRVSMGRLRDLRVPLPPLELQQRFIKHVLSYDQLDSRREQRRNATDRLCLLLHQQAFTGELTAGWRDAHMTELLQEMEHQAKTLAEAP